MKVVLDTNVLISGVFFGGVPAAILTAWREERFELVLSETILTEYRRVAGELTAGRPILAEAWVPIGAAIASHATLVDTPALPLPVSADPDDDAFLACAWAAGAEIVVSGDQHLRRVSGWNGIKVLTPRQFSDQFLVPGTP
jgi:uncharacterized protein